MPEARSAFGSSARLKISLETLSGEKVQLTKAVGRAVRAEEMGG